MNEGMIILQSEALASMTKAEVDIQISTAKTYPRNLPDVLNKLETLVTIDEETAADCFYALKRGKNDDAQIIEGLSVRFAEILVNSWGNIRIQTNIIGNDGKKITARGICHDLESNVAVSVEVHRRIVDKQGKTYSDDMQIVTGNAASSIAFRNAALKVIPKAITKKIVEKAKQVSIGKATDLQTTRQKMVEAYKKIGVTEAELLQHIEKKSIVEIDIETVMYLRGLFNALKEGTATVEGTFRHKPEPKAAEVPEFMKTDNDPEKQTESKPDEKEAKATDPAKKTKKAEQSNLDLK